MTTRLSQWNYLLDVHSAASGPAPDWEWRLAFVKRWSHLWQ